MNVDDDYQEPDHGLHENQVDEDHEDVETYPEETYLESEDENPEENSSHANDLEEHVLEHPDYSQVEESLPKEHVEHEVPVVPQSTQDPQPHLYQEETTPNDLEEYEEETSHQPIDEQEEYEEDSYHEEDYDDYEEYTEPEDAYVEPTTTSNHSGVSTNRAVKISI